MLSMMTNDASASPNTYSHNVVVSFRAACEAANLSVSTMRRLVQAGRGPRILKLSDRRIGIRRADLDEWLADRMASHMGGPTHA